MRRSELRAQRRRRREEGRRNRQRVRERMQNQLQRLRERPALKAHRDALAKRRQRRRRRTLAALSLLLLLLLLVQCERPQPGPGRVAHPVANASPAQTPFGARLKTQNRPGYSVAARPGPNWLDDFRLQVAARSPRLAECFNGTERGGAFRWTVSVDAKTGAVTGHDFDPLAGTTLTNAQKTCAAKALSQPGYRLKEPKSQALPNRVSLVLEF